jgi:acyl-CoA synthetase (AMP-forming)/AMP-acid ligase II
VPSLPTLPAPLEKLTSRAASAGYGLKVLAESGIIKPYSPVTLAKVGRTLRQWGTGPAGGFLAMATLTPDKVWIVDEHGDLTFHEVDRRTNALARALQALGVGEGDAIALMARNHRGFVEATIAAAKLGADLIYLNTAFAGPQLVDVLEREDPTVVIHDEEFTGMLEKAHHDTRVLSWTDEDGGTTLDSRIAGESDDSPLEAPEHHTRIIILTSGTTGTPKGAPRNEAGIDAAISLLSRMPLRQGWTVHIAAPLFHTWGFAHMMLSLLLGHTLVLRRKFDPEGALEVAEEQACEGIVVIPVMLQRILGLPEETLDKHSLESVKVVAASGSALPGDLAVTWMDHFGDNLYNIYGSTEVAYASIATPEDLREAPDSAGKPPWATVVKIYDEKSERELPHGESGRIFVGNSLLFEGYTGGGQKDMIDGLMSSGDVGRFGDDGRLYVEGRDDEMIVSGGENVFPKEVEDCLARHEAVVEVAAIGVDDDDFGKRLRAFVVLKDGTDASEDDLKAHVKDNLARYKVPREIVVLDELPRNATGKVLKRELAEHGPDDSDSDSDTDSSTDSGSDDE